MPIGDDDFARLKSLYGSSLWSSPKQCKTCGGKRVFKRRDPDGIHEYECPCEEQWMLHLWLLNAGIGLAYQRLGLSDVKAVKKDPLMAFYSYLDPEALERSLRLGRGLMLWSGDKGTGKSLLANLALKRVMESGYDGYYTTFTDMVDTYQSTWRDDDQRRWFDRRVRNAGFLVIDDIGREHRNTQVIESMFDAVMRGRGTASMPTIITTNLSPEEIQHGYGPNVLSLLTGSMTHVEVQGLDYRNTYREMLDQDAADGVDRPVVML